MPKQSKLSIEEIARCLYKKGYADSREYSKALDAVEQLSYEDTLELERIAVKHYGAEQWSHN